MILVQKNVTYTASGSGTANPSESLDMTSCSGAAIQVTTATVGSAGAFKLQCSNFLSNGWVDVPASQGAVVSGTIAGAGTFMLTTGSFQAYYSQLRVLVTPSNATPIALVLNMIGKG